MDVSFAQQKEKTSLIPSLPQPVKFPGLKEAWMRLQNSALSGPITSTFNAMRFDKEIKK